MTRRLIALPLLSTLMLGACASLTGPSSDEIARLPVVNYGQPAPATGEFVLRYPAGVDLPVNAKVLGTLLEKSDEAVLKVRVKRDVYAYKDRASFDGKTWHPSHKLVGGRFTISVPGERNGRVDAQSPGELSAEFNLKP
jgi:hypothetical protein